jgi:hypothetical protein
MDGLADLARHADEHESLSTPLADERMEERHSDGLRPEGAEQRRKGVSYATDRRSGSREATPALNPFAFNTTECVAQSLFGDATGAKSQIRILLSLFGEKFHVCARSTYNLISHITLKLCFTPLSGKIFMQTVFSHPARAYGCVRGRAYNTTRAPPASSRALACNPTHVPPTR